MLTGDRPKYLGLIFAIAFSTFLMSHQASIFCGPMRRTGRQIAEGRDASIGMLDPKTNGREEGKATTDEDLCGRGGGEGMGGAVPLCKGAAGEAQAPPHQRPSTD